MAVPYTFATATGSIPLSQLDTNFATGIMIGNTTVTLGDTITTINNLTLANVTVTSASFSNVTLTGNTTFSGAAVRVLGDFSNGTVSNRTSFQDATANGTTSIGALPNGTATTSGWVAFNNSNPTNAGYAALLGTVGEVQLISNATGSGNVTQLSIYVGSILRFKIQTDGAFVFYNNAGTRTASLDASGNFIALGNVIPNGTP
jgi:hypothetical protein